MLTKIHVFRIWSHHTPLVFFRFETNKWNQGYKLIRKQNKHEFCSWFITLATGSRFSIMSQAIELFYWFCINPRKNSVIELDTTLLHCKLHATCAALDCVLLSGKEKQLSTIGSKGDRVEYTIYGPYLVWVKEKPRKKVAKLPCQLNFRTGSTRTYFECQLPALLLASFSHCGYCCRSCFFLVVLRIIMLRIHSNFLNMGILPLAQCATTLRAYDCFKAKWQQQEEKKEPHNGATRRSCTTFWYRLN